MDLTICLLPTACISMKTPEWHPFKAIRCMYLRTYFTIYSVLSIPCIMVLVVSKQSIVFFRKNVFCSFSTLLNRSQLCSWCISLQTGHWLFFWCSRFPFRLFCVNVLESIYSRRTSQENRREWGGGVCFLVVPVHQWNLSRDDTHITSVRIVQFSRSATLLSIYFQTFSACLDLRRLNLNDSISKKLWNNNRTVHVNEWNQNKTKPTNVTFKCTAHSVVWFSPQTMQCIIKVWLHCLTPESIGRFFVNNILILYSYYSYVQ